MKQQINEFTTRTTNQARAFAGRTGAETRNVLERAANGLIGAKRPAEQLADKSLKLTGIAHKTFEKLVKLQLRGFEAGIDAGAKRLRLAAEADSLKGFVDAQIELFPVARERITSEARELIGIFVGTRDEVFKAVKGTDKKQARKSPAKKKVVAKKTA
ncbi:MAG: phasin family protein [Gammaproteobacteria bacterium]